MKRLYHPILTPLIFIILGYFTSARMDLFTDQEMKVIFYMPFVILLLAAILAWKFNRSRYFFMLIIFYLCLFATYQQSMIKAVYNYNNFSVILSTLLPINIVLFALLKERGIFSIWGLLRFALIILQAGFTFWAVESEQKKLIRYLATPILPKHLDFILISQITILFFILSILILVTRLLLYQQSQDIYLLFILVTAFIIVNSKGIYVISIYYTVIGIILISAVLQDTYFMAFYDELTGLPSRRALNQDLMKLGIKYSIAMLDIDFFKKFNDSYGHETGDEVLKFIASRFKNVKGGGKAYRYGGEEFTILFRGKNLNEILPALEDLREGIANRGFVLRRKRRSKSKKRRKVKTNSIRRKLNKNNSRKVNIHVSIGAAQRDEVQKNPTAVLKAADQALYRAKKRGRNCVCK